MAIVPNFKKTAVILILSCKYYDYFTMKWLSSKVWVLKCATFHGVIWLLLRNQCFLLWIRCPWVNRNGPSSSLITQQHLVLLASPPRCALSPCLPGAMSSRLLLLPLPEISSLRILFSREVFSNKLRATDIYKTYSRYLRWNQNSNF